MFTRRRVLELGLMSSASFLPWPLPLPRALARVPGQVPEFQSDPQICDAASRAAGDAAKRHYQQ